MKGSGFRVRGSVLALSVLGVLAVQSGCSMDEKILDVDQKYYETTALTLAAVNKGAAAWGETEDSRHVLELASIDADAAKFLDRHTADDGRLVSIDATGKQQPLLRSDLEQFVKDRDGRVVAARLNHERNRAAIQALRDAVAKYQAASELWIDKKSEWVEKRKSLAAAANAALSALSGIGGGIAIGAGI